MGIAEKVSRSEVKGQGHDQTECCDGGGMHFVSTMWRQGSFVFYVFHSLCQHSGLLPSAYCRTDSVDSKTPISRGNDLMGLRLQNVMVGR